MSSRQHQKLSWWLLKENRILNSKRIILLSPRFWYPPPRTNSVMLFSCFDFSFGVVDRHRFVWLLHFLGFSHTAWSRHDFVIILIDGFWQNFRNEESIRKSLCWIKLSDCFKYRDSHIPRRDRSILSLVQWN